MSSAVQGSVDQGLERAWREFGVWLGDAIADLAPGRALSVHAPTALDEDDLDGEEPSVEIFHESSGRLVGQAPDNQWLDESCRMDAPGLRLMVDLGWSTGRPGSGFRVELDHRPDADRMSAITVRTVRDVHGVVHPSFLTIDPPDLLRSFTGSPVSSPTAHQPARSEPAEVAHPSGHDDTVRLVTEAVDWAFGDAVGVDDEGDLEIAGLHGSVHLRVPQGVPVVRVWAVLVEDVADEAAATFEANVLNWRYVGPQVVLRGGALVVRAEVGVLPFVARHLCDLLAQVRRLVDCESTDLAHRVGRVGEPAYDDDEPRPERVTVPPEMLTVLGLEARVPGGLDATTVASIFDLDADLLLELVTAHAEGRLAHRSGRRPDDAAVTARCVELMWGALRVVVESRAGRGPQRR